VYAFRANGLAVSGWPKSLNGNNIEGSPTAVDLDGDGLLEVLVQERAYPIGIVHAFYADGRPFPGAWPVSLDHLATGTPAVGDLDGDGLIEIVCLSYNSVWVLRPDGTSKPGFPYDVFARHNAHFSYQSPALGDLDRDGKLEIVTACHFSGAGCYVFRHDGTLQPNWPQTFGGTWSYCPPTLADVDRNGTLEVLCGRAGGTAAGITLDVWRADGSRLPGFPIVQPGGAEGQIAVGDIDTDGTMEILFDSNLAESATGQGWLHCVDATGAVEPGFPLRTAGFSYMNGATLGDVDGDGLLELGVVSTMGSVATVALYKLTGPANPGQILWKGYHEGNERRGLTAESDRFALVGDVVPGGVLRLEMQGTTPNGYFVLLGTKTGILPIPGVTGFLRIDPVQPISTLVSAVLGPNGRARSNVPIPNIPALRGVLLVLQGLEAAPGPRYALRQMRAVRVR
jgi:hypothetical protein